MKWLKELFKIPIGRTISVSDAKNEIAVIVKLIENQNYDFQYSDEYYSILAEIVGAVYSNRSDLQGKKQLKRILKSSKYNAVWGFVYSASKDMNIFLNTLLHYWK
jgi:hypothetical protein